MTTSDDREQKIIVKKNGPYVVHGDVPLVRKVQVVSEHGEPLTWKKEDTLPTEEVYALCRCGQSDRKPFCDRTHAKVGFDGTETADSRPTAERQVVCAGGTQIVVRRDNALCMESGFCADRAATLEQMVPATADTGVRARVMAMIEHCPSGALTYALAEGAADIEPDLPRQVAVTTEITSAGPVAAALWVTGHIPVERADGQPLETRNRVTLCCCGLSKDKPLCDGAHRTTLAPKAD